MSRTTVGQPLSRPIARFLTVILALLFTVIAACGDDNNNKSKNPVPVLTGLSPTSATVGDAAFTLTVTGAGFVQGAQVQWAGADRATTFLGATQISVAISAADVAQVGSVNVTVRNPAPTVGPSNALQFAVTVVPAPPPSGYPVRITIGLDGSSPNGPSVNGGMDWDGNHVIFASKASNLAAGDSNDAYDLFIRDTCNSVAGAASCTPATRRIVMAADGSQPNGDSGSTATSPENSLAVSFFGRHVAFVSSASNLVAGDTNGVDDVYFKTCLVQVGQSACTPAMVRASVRADGSQSPFPAGYPAVAEDGRYVLFVSADPNMVAGDANGVADVFLRDTCVGAESGCTPSTTRVSAPAGSGDANGASGEPVFTGRYVAFTSTASNLVPGDTNGVSDVFLHDTCIGAASACTPSTERISVGIGGEQANGASFDPQVSYPMAAWGGYDEHGRFVAFTSAASNLVAGDTNGATDVFERDTCRWWPGCVPSTTRVSVTSTGAQIDGASWGPDFLRWDGETLPFVTAANGVVPEDTNGVEDVYVRHACPFGAPDYCVSSTARYSVGTGGVQLNGASFAPRLSHDPWGAWLVTFISEATNVVAGGASPSGHPSIYMIVR